MDTKGLNEKLLNVNNGKERRDEKGLGIVTEESEENG